MTNQAGKREEDVLFVAARQSFSAIKLINSVPH